MVVTEWRVDESYLHEATCLVTILRFEDEDDDATRTATRTRTGTWDTDVGRSRLSTGVLHVRRGRLLRGPRRLGRAGDMRERLHSDAAKPDSRGRRLRVHAPRLYAVSDARPLSPRAAAREATRGGIDAGRGLEWDHCCLCVADYGSEGLRRRAAEVGFLWHGSDARRVINDHEDEDDNGRGRARRSRRGRRRRRLDQTASVASRSGGYDDQGRMRLRQCIAPRWDTIGGRATAAIRPRTPCVLRAAAAGQTGVRRQPWQRMSVECARARCDSSACDGGGSRHRWPTGPIGGRRPPTQQPSAAPDAATSARAERKSRRGPHDRPAPRSRPPPPDPAAVGETGTADPHESAEPPTYAVGLALDRRRDPRRDRTPVGLATTEPWRPTPCPTPEPTPVPGNPTATAYPTTD